MADEEQTEPERREYLMSDEELIAFGEAAKPVPMIYDALGRPPTSPQEKVNVLWKRLAMKYNFIWNTAEAVEGKAPCFFSAIPNKE